MLDLETARKSEDLIVVNAQLTLKATAEGGKSNPIHSGYRPNHSFEKLENIKNTSFYIGEVQFNDKECIFPGETSVVTVIFMRVPGIDKYLTPGHQWYVYEGSRLVAEGEILQLD